MANFATTAKPKTGGAVRVGATTLQLPTSVTEEPSGFIDLGVLSEEGFTNGFTRESEPIKCWGGAIVLTSQTSVEDTFELAFMGVNDVNVKKEIYGHDNVTGTLATGITTHVTDDEPETRSWVLDVQMADGILHRIVIPRGKVTALEAIEYKAESAMVYKVTITAEFVDGKAHHEYTFQPTPESE